MPATAAGLTQGLLLLARRAPPPLLLCCVRSVGGLLAALTAGTAVSLFALYRFATADADLALLLRGRHKPGAFRGKVVWITGASQVRCVGLHACADSSSSHCQGCCAHASAMTCTQARTCERMPLALQGLGEVVATYLAAQGAKLILSSRSRDKLQVRMQRMACTCMLSQHSRLTQQLLLARLSLAPTTRLHSTHPPRRPSRMRAAPRRLSASSCCRSTCWTAPTSWAQQRRRRTPRLAVLASTS